MTNDNEMSIEGMPPPEEPTPAPPPPEDAEPAATGAAESVAETIEAGTDAAAAAAAEAEAAVESPPEPVLLPEPEPVAEEPASAVPAVVPATAGSAREEAPHKTAIMDHLTSDSEYDPDASNDDKIMAALAYASQLIIPLLVPIIILISETSKKRAFQRYHAVQSIAVSVVIWSLELGLSLLASVAVVSLIGVLCLCFIIPAMIVLWLLPLYYAILAYSGKRFSIPGLTQFLQDQRWL